VSAGEEANDALEPTHGSWREEVQNRQRLHLHALRARAVHACALRRFVELTATESPHGPGGRFVALSQHELLRSDWRGGHFSVTLLTPGRISCDGPTTRASELGYQRCRSRRPGREANGQSACAILTLRLHHERLRRAIRADLELGQIS
jgi:hypothetical protein